MCRGSTCMSSFGSMKPINFDKGSIHFVGKNEGVGGKSNAYEIIPLNLFTEFVQKV